MNNSHVINDISEVEEHTINEKWNLTSHFKANEIYILYVRKGNGKLERNGESFSLEQKDFFVIFGADKQREVYIKPTFSMNLFIIKFTSASVYRLNGKWIVDEIKPQNLVANHINKANHAIVNYHQDELYRLWKNNEDNQEYNKLFQKYFNRMIKEINKIFESNKLKQDHILNEVKSYMDNHFDEPIQMNDLVKFSGKNLTTFYKEFKKYTGYPPLQYITNKRIEKAKHLLLSTSMQNADIANEVGYHDVYYFSRIFKRTVGVSPRHFSKLCNKEIFVLTPAFAVNLLALGISKELIYPLSKSDVENFLMHSKKGEINIEEVNSMNPEYIIFPEEKQISLNEFQQIAPTSLIPYKNLSWRDQLLQLAIEIGSKDLAQKWLNQFDKRLDEVREKVKNNIGNETVLAIRMLEGKVRIFGEKRRKLSDFLYRELQLNPPSFIQGVSFYDVSYDSEELKDLNVDHVLLLNDQSTEGETAIMKNKITGNIYEISNLPWLSYSAWGHEKILTEALKILA